MAMYIVCHRLKLLLVTMRPKWNIVTGLELPRSTSVLLSEKEEEEKGTLICCLPFVRGNEFYVHSEIVNNVNAPNVNKNSYISL